MSKHLALRAARSEARLKKVPAKVLEALGEFDSATVQNAAILVRGYAPASVDYSGPSLSCLIPELTPVVGYAVTAELTPITPREDPADWNDYYDSMAYAGAPTIAVLKDVDPTPRRGAIMGDGMAYRHRALGCVGVVVDGNARDVPGIKKAGCALWATGRVPGHGPFNIVRHGVPMVAAGLYVEPGDILVCDSDGVTRVPIDIASDVARKAGEVRRKEAALHRYFSAPGFSLEKYEAWKRQQS
ncbi:MAG: RraA family protein [Chloroflexi bacterium]|nr:RraA family protein [Chloroflexota bacterium]